MLLELECTFEYLNKNNECVKVLNDFENECILIINYTNGNCKMLKDIKNMYYDMLSMVASECVSIWGMYEDTIKNILDTIDMFIIDNCEVENMKKLKFMIEEYCENECIEL